MTPDECYFCLAPAADYLCRDCAAAGHTKQEIATKRLIASILKHPAKG